MSQGIYLPSCFVTNAGYITVEHQLSVKMNSSWHGSNGFCRYDGVLSDETYNLFGLVYK